MIKINNEKDCCGCEACVQACPKKCIDLKVKNGFWYPEVNTEKCIECNLCNRSCPIENTPESNSMLKCYASYWDDSIRMQSSSGGIFSKIANRILTDGGVVFGAAFDKDYNVCHTFVESVDEMSLLRGSKYLQSHINDSYQKAKSYLEAGKKVMFSGTACQIAGLRAFLKKDYDNLLTVDVLCHGVPSPELWKKYINNLKNKYNSEIEKVNFRDKSTGWSKYSVHINFKNGQEYKKEYAQDVYMMMFLKNICLRPSCHSCKFKSLERVSDISLGDFWGVQNNYAEAYDNKGTSIILTHTEKGEHILKSVSDDLFIMETEVEKSLPHNSDARNSVTAHPLREKFITALNNDASFEDLAKIIKDPLKIRIKNKIINCLRRIKRKIRH